MSVLRTERLTLLPWPEHHQDFVAAYQQDPRVMRYLGNGQPWDRERHAVVQDLQRDLWAQHGYGWRIATRTADGSIVGVATSNPVGDGIPDLDPAAHELGWWLVADAWRQGFGTEIGLAIRAEAHEAVGSADVLARLQPENAGSAGVATAIGLTYSGDIRGRFGELNAVYRGTAADWQARRRS